MKYRTSPLSDIKNARFHTLRATPETVHWGYFDKKLNPALEVDSGDVVYVETVTHHAGDAPDLMMDDGIKEIYDSIPEENRKPGPHLMTGPIHVAGAEPGDILEVQILDLEPRLRYGANVGAAWGYLFEEFDENERVRIYEIDDANEWVTAKFSYHYPGKYEIPGGMVHPEDTERTEALPGIQIPARIHVGTIGVAPAEEGPIDTTPPDIHGGNIDNWQIAKGTTMYYPVQTEGSLLSLGDAHLAQGNSELTGTAVEASVNCLIRVTVRKDLSYRLPILETEEHWMIHAFHKDLEEAVRTGSLESISFLQEIGGLKKHDAYSFLSVGADFMITQVVNGNKGIHVKIPKNAFKSK
ncbi:formamidase [Mesobacillus campisalis]|uniref:Formamidase n=1 Tax=Mesobacillus campisalis TaxID=1408103 RepID=A0A0M2SRX5_9BACI|nr:acetamidase/formamidase family protein [Mesobacillus campisalis]KKK36903.1 formamidase [Mesobacillus campisalis]